VSVLNVTMHPHSPDSYLKLLKEASRVVKEVPYFGSRVARLGGVYSVPDSDRYYRGVLFTFDKIDISGEWFDQERNDVADSEQIESIFIPSNLHPNLKRMDFILDIKSHKMYFQARNINGDSFSPRNVERVFKDLLNQPHLHSLFGTVDVTVVPAAEAVERILSMDGLSRLHIHLVRPNPDDNDEAYLAVLQKLQRQNVRSLDVVLTKAADAERIEPDEDTRRQAKVAAAGNGYTEGTGRGAGNQPIKESTRDHPVLDAVAIADKSIDPFDAFLQHVKQHKI
jgi:hypothetical protein